ncbi:MAG: phosphotransferase [Pseudomonadota bacterium]
MLRTAQAALSYWPLRVAEVALFAQRENQIFKVTGENGASYALRLHRKGYQSHAALQSELHWMQHLHQHGVRVPQPVPTASGTHLIHHDGYAIDLLTWLDGQPLGRTGAPLACEARSETFFKLGGTLAHVHRISDAWEKPREFERSAWDLDGLIGETPLWGRYLDSPALRPAERDLLIAVRDKIRAELDRTTLDYGLVHADAVPENVLLSGDQPALIDFDDSGFGYRLFDIATAMIKHRKEADFATLESALIDGYRSVRPIDTTQLSAFYVLRAQTYIGWIMERIDEPGAAERQARVIAATMQCADAYLSGDSA